MANLSRSIGAAIDRRDADPGIKGAVIGLIVQRAGKAALPLPVTAVVGWAFCGWCGASAVGPLSLSRQRQDTIVE